MDNGRLLLRIAAGSLGVLVAGAGLGRSLLNAQTSPAGPAAPATPAASINNLNRFDTSGHKVSFVTVEPGVQHLSDKPCGQSCCRSYAA